jgi:hypothetical protein
MSNWPCRSVRKMQRAGFTHPALLVDDLTGMVAALEAVGLAVTPDDPVDGRERCYVSDPFDNRIELMQG